MYQIEKMDNYKERLVLRNYPHPSPNSAAESMKMITIYFLTFKIVMKGFMIKM